MSDEQIVRTLADFMGLIPPDEQGLFPRGSGWCVAVPLGEINTAVALPCYLTSYDALAPVWRKLSNRPLSVAYGKIFAEGPWFEVSPRGHAETIATAIQEAKG